MAKIRKTASIENGIMQVLSILNEDEIQNATADFGISPAFVLAVIIVESGGRVEAVSHANAGGLMQLIPATAKRFKVADRFDAEANIAGGTEYLRFLLDQFNQDPLLALAGYNAGENAVIKRSAVPNFAETRDYIPKVVAAWSVAKTLCAAEPVVATDPCIFDLD